jgi:hypothetical protein
MFERVYPHWSGQATNADTGALCENLPPDTGANRSLAECERWIGRCPQRTGQHLRIVSDDTTS